MASSVGGLPSGNPLATSDWRVQWRANRLRTVGGVPTVVPDDVKWEDGHDIVSLGGKVSELLASDPPPCWLWVEDLCSKHKGSSVEKPKPKKGGKS